MVFSSTIFLFLFLPVVLGAYFACPRRGKNLLLLLASLLFYAWGELALVFVMIASIVLNYLMGLWIARAQETGRAPGVLAIAVAANLGLLVYFKYTNFFIDNVNRLLPALGIEAAENRQIILPLGISFFTFQAMSYLIDVYRGTACVQKNPVNLALYIALFPQLIAGPIVRYHDVAAQIVKRTVSRDGFAEGVRRFIIGLGKKVLIANTVGATADAVFAVPSAEITGSLAWLGVACYTVQIYFDFSGYSDMAIGLGRMFGFRFLENFNYPYIARSITEFWRRWHISLSSWFRDYLYIPLGGNRAGPRRLYANLLIVFLLCGLWHGASWNFAIWGLYHGAFLVIERRGLGRRLANLAAPIQHVYVLLVVMVGWVFFRAETLTAAFVFLRAMIGLSQADSLTYHPAMYLNWGLVLAGAAGVVGSIPVIPWTRRLLESRASRRPVPQPETGLTGVAYAMGSTVLLCTVLAASMIVLSSATHNPFIYFRF